MREEGIVKETEGGICKVSVKRKSACGENCENCGGACRMPEEICIAQNAVGAKKGDRVIVEMDSKNVLKAAFLVYTLPLLVLFAAYAVADALNVPEQTAILTSLAATVLTFGVLYFFNRKNDGKYTSVVIEITKNADI